MIRGPKSPATPRKREPNTDRLKLLSLLILLGLGSGLARGQSGPVPLPDAVKSMTVPPGFRVSLFAGEPDVVQPIAMTTDDRGRLWVVECLSYPDWQTNRNADGRDRVLIFEDRDGDGRFDSRTVFWDKGRNLAGIAWGFSGVWLCSAPELIFIPDRDRDDRPDGPPQTVLDGWSLEAKHNIVNGLAWGPDGWLYGCHGILSTSRPGIPGTAVASRPELNCGVWRVHPVTHQSEVVAHGTTNPWGIAFDEEGALFVANCVIKHLFQIIPGAHYARMYGQDINPYSFQLIQSCADHIHWAGGWWKTEGAEHSQNDAAGGGHAHCGAMVYLGDNFPDEYRNRFFTLNVHGHRMNQDILVRSGSGYVARHGADLVKSSDSWFRGTALTYGPDGGVYISDWSDAEECHDYLDIHRENGRIYKLTYGPPAKAGRVDLAALPDRELLQLQSHKNEWFASHARLLLEERAATGKLEAASGATAFELFQQAPTAARQLRALWVLFALGELTEKAAAAALASPHEAVRAWAVRLKLDGGGPGSSPASRASATSSGAPPGRSGNRDDVTWMTEVARNDSAAIVHLALASGLQRLPLEKRLGLAEALASTPKHSADANIPLMIWYAIEPLVSANDQAAQSFLVAARIPLVRQLTAQRLALRLALGPAISGILRAPDSTAEADIIEGLYEALQGRRQIPAPVEWAQVQAKLARHEQAQVREKALYLSVIFGDREAARELSGKVSSVAADPAFRQKGLETLIQCRVAGLDGLLKRLLGDEKLRRLALRGLAVFDDPATANEVLREYPRLSVEEKMEALNTLASRAGFARVFLSAVRSGEIPRRDISPFVARQLQALQDREVTALLKETVGEIRPASADKAGQIAKYKQLLTEAALKGADRSAGRRVFTRTCAPCHRLFDEGGTLAPELTGSQRSSLDYVLENIVDPNAIVWSQWRATYFETSDDRTLTGVVLKENESAVSIQTQSGIITLARNDITARRDSNLSMMPEGLFDGLKPEEIIDLVSYLQSPGPVPSK